MRRIYRSADDMRPANTLVTRKGAIHWVGDSNDAPEADRTIDMQGATVIAGLTDAHVHLFAIAKRAAADPVEWAGRPHCCGCPASRSGGGKFKLARTVDQICRF